MGRVAGKVAIVTGAASGLGAADARRLAEEGASVVLTDVNAALGRETAAAIPGAVFLEQDVRDEARWAAVVAETVERFGGLHILVNNAGLVRFASVEDCTLDEFRLHQQVMIDVIPAYSAAKGAIVSMTRSIAVHCQEQKYGIRVNALMPGAHDTPMTRQAVAQLAPEEAGLAQLQAMGQGRPEDVANLILFLVSDEGRQITGTAITIDNGETMK
jgi:3(or 17)beta-hydroxysteroid dehydrogenase